jgi:hypothetical protein
VTTGGGKAIGPNDTVRWLELRSSGEERTSWLIDPEPIHYVHEPAASIVIGRLGLQSFPYGACLPDRVFAPAACQFAWTTSPLVEIWDLMQNIFRAHGDGELYVFAPETHVSQGRVVINVGADATEPRFRQLVLERLHSDRPTIEWVFGHSQRVAMFVDHHAGLIVIGTTRSDLDLRGVRGSDKLVTLDQALAHVMPRLPEEVREAWAERLRGSYPARATAP